MILIDTSSWIHLLCPDGDPTARGRVDAVLKAGTACWCPIVQLELWNGARGEREKRVLYDFARVLPSLPINEDVWCAAYELARRARARGVTVPAIDVIIVACARHHGVGLESTDDDFNSLRRVAE